MKILNLMILVLLLSGCSTVEEKIVKPPSMPPYTICDESQQLLICDSEKLEECYGFLDG